MDFSITLSPVPDLVSPTVTSLLLMSKFVNTVNTGIKFVLILSGKKVIKSVDAPKIQSSALPLIRCAYFKAIAL
jgi:hypothetical protein